LAFGKAIRTTFSCAVRMSVVNASPYKFNVVRISE